GQVIPQIFGQFGGIAGNVFWSTDKRVHVKTSSIGGKGLGGGGGAQITTTKTYTVSMAIGIADTRLTGPLTLEKVWRDLTLFIDLTGGDTGGSPGTGYSVIATGFDYAVG